MRKIRCIYILLVAISLLASCRKDKLVYQVTPYNLNIPSHFPQMQIPEDNPMTVEGVELGRHLFYEKQLSRDNSISCASCHIQAHGFADPSKFSVGVDGVVGRRQSMAIVNLGWQTSFFWDGRSGSLEDQVFHPIPDPTEMDLPWDAAVNRLKAIEKYNNMFLKAFGTQDYDSTHVSKAIAQFMRTMISGKSKYDVMFKFRNNLPLTAEEEAIRQSIPTSEWAAIDAGFDIFFSLTSGDCLHCHDGALMHVNMFSNNGLDMTFEDEGRYEVTGNPNHKGHFKVPTLRNIAQTAPYMHNGRFQTLDEVINHYAFGVVVSPTIDPMMEFAHQGGNNLDAQERSLLKIFLESLTDESFLKNPAFSDPN